MNIYQVFDASPDGREVALLDKRGRCHLARAIGVSASPAVGLRLEGRRLAMGPAKLGCGMTSRVYDLEVAALDCDRQQMIERLHPQVTRF